MRELSAHVPEVNYGDPTKLVTSDSGVTYEFPDNYVGSGVTEVFACEIYDTLLRGRLLKPATFWSASGDYVFEGDKIRFPGGQTQTFRDGPYARYVQLPPPITAIQEPVLKPKDARALIVTRAAILWATQGGFLDPAVYEGYENRLYYGVPERGIIGIQASLQAGDTFGGTQAYEEAWTPWYRGINDPA